jgi:hypothetical protein
MSVGKLLRNYKFCAYNRKSKYISFSPIHTTLTTSLSASAPLCLIRPRLLPPFES